MMITRQDVIAAQRTIEALRDAGSMGIPISMLVAALEARGVNARYIITLLIVAKKINVKGVAYGS